MANSSDRNKFGAVWWVTSVLVLFVGAMAGVAIVENFRAKEPATPTDFATAYSTPSSNNFYTAPKEDSTGEDAVLAELEKYGDPDDKDKPEGATGTRFENFPLAVDPDDAKRLLAAGSKLKLDVQSEGYTELTMGKLALYLGNKEKAKYHLERARKAGSKGALAYLANPLLEEKPMTRYEELKAAADGGYPRAREMLSTFRQETEAYLDRNTGHPEDKQNKDLGIGENQLAAEPAERMRQIIDDYLPYAQLDDVPGRFLFGMGRLAYFLNYDGKARIYLNAAATKKVQPSIVANYYLAKLTTDEEDPEFTKRHGLLKSAVDAGFKQAEPELVKNDAKVFKLSSFAGPDVISALLQGNVESLFNAGVKFDVQIDSGTEASLRRVFTIVYVASFVKYFEDPEPTFISDGRLKDLVIGGSAARGELLMKGTSEATGINLAQLMIPFGVAKQNISAIGGGGSGSGLSNIIGMIANVVGGGHVSDVKDIRFSIVQEMAVMDARNCLLYWREGNKKNVKQVYDSAVRFVRMRDTP